MTKAIGGLTMTNYREILRLSSLRSLLRDTPVRRSNSAKLIRSREKESPWNAFISSMACAILGAKPLPFCSFIAIPFHWVVGSFQCTGFKRASVVALSFPTKFGLERPTLEG